MWWDGWYWSAQYGDECAVCGHWNVLEAVAGAMAYAVLGEWAGRVRSES